MEYWIWDPKTDELRTTRDVVEWGRNREDHGRVARYEEDGLLISTVFLGIIHWGDTLFETMACRGNEELGQWRFRTAAEARAFHARLTAKPMLDRIRSGEDLYTILEE